MLTLKHEYVSLEMISLVIRAARGFLSPLMLWTTAIRHEPTGTCPWWGELKIKTKGRIVAWGYRQTSYALPDCDELLPCEDSIVWVEIWPGVLLAASCFSFLFPMPPWR